MKPQAGNTEGQASMQEMLEEKRLETKRSRRTAIWSILVIVLFCMGGLMFTRSGVFLVIGFPALIGLVFVSILAVSTPPEPRLSMDEYKSLPGAVDARRGHACLQCGHHGIYRRTVYRTTTTLADCSACQAPLWQS
jgi:hypothetical protein